MYCRPPIYTAQLQSDQSTTIKQTHNQNLTITTAKISSRFGDSAAASSAAGSGSEATGSGASRTAESVSDDLGTIGNARRGEEERNLCDEKEEEEKERLEVVN